MSERSDIKIVGIEDCRQLSLPRTPRLSQRTTQSHNNNNQNHNNNNNSSHHQRNTGSTSGSASSLRQEGIVVLEQQQHHHQHQQQQQQQHDSEVIQRRNVNVSVSVVQNPIPQFHPPLHPPPQKHHHNNILIEEVIGGINNKTNNKSSAVVAAAIIPTASISASAVVASGQTSSSVTQQHQQHQQQQQHNSDGTHLSVHRLIHCHALTSPSSSTGEGDNSSHQEQQQLDHHHHQQQQQQHHEVHVTTITGDPNSSGGDEDDENRGGHRLTTYRVLSEEVLTDIGHGGGGHQLQVQEVEEVEPLVEDGVHGNCTEVQDENGTTVRLNLTSGHHQHLHRSHHLNESGRSTTTRLITIPVVGSLTPYTVLNPNDSDETNNGGTISVTLPSDVSHMGHEQEHSSMIVETRLIPSPPITSQSNSHVTWEEAVAASILPVRCKDTNAELYKGKFGSGNKGKCIKFANDWYTPTEFEALCGRGNSKDWKRSIRFGGRTLQTLIDKGHLVPHASSCICSNCVDDATATGPIRPFTPYQRKRKGQNTNEHVKGIKLERLTSKDSTTDESSDIGTPITPLGLTTAINPLTQALLKINHIALPSCTQDAWKVVEDAVDSLTTASASIKALVQEMRERTNQEMDSLRSQLQNSVQTTLVQNPVVGHPQILRIFDSNRIQTYSIEVLDPDSFKPVQSNSTSLSKCENCGRDGSLECSGCHVVHYCSSFCQKKDWPLHQAACQDQLHVECKEEPDMDMK